MCVLIRTFTKSKAGTIMQQRDSEVVVNASVHSNCEMIERAAEIVRTPEKIEKMRAHFIHMEKTFTDVYKWVYFPIPL
jgi:hypothetical protein